MDEDPTATAEAADASPSLLEGALRAAGSDAARYVPLRFFAALTSLVTVPVFTAAIGKADYGAFYLVSSAVTLASALSTGWLYPSAVRFYWPSKRGGRIDAYTATVLWSAVVSLAATTMIAWAASLMGAGALTPLILRLIPAALAYFFFNTITNILVQVLRSANRAAAFARMQMLGTLLTTVFSVALVWWGHMGAMGIFAGVALGWAGVLPFMLREIRREGALAPAAADREMLSTFLAYGLPLVPVGVAEWALTLIDRFVIGAFRGTAEVGLYSVAYSLGDRIMQLATLPLILTITPSLIATFEKQGQRLAERMQTQFVRYYALVTFPLLAGMAVAGRTFMRGFTGGSYWDAWPVLSIVAAASMLASFNQIAATGLSLHKRTKLLMANTLTAAAFNLAANVALVPRFGYVAAAWDNVAAYVVLLALTLWQSRRYMRLHVPWSAVARTALASIGMAAVVGLAFSGVAATDSRPTALWVLAGQAALGLAAYPALLAALHVIKPEEYAFLRELAGRAAARLRR